MSTHNGEIEQSFDGWFTARCACGWEQGPFVARQDAMDALFEHVPDEPVFRKLPSPEEE